VKTQIIIILKKNSTWKKYLAQYEHTREQGKVQSQLHGVSKHRYQRQKGQCTTRQPSWQWDLGHKTIKQNNYKGVTVGQSPATWDRTHTQTTTNNRKRKTRVSIQIFGKRSHTQTTTY